MIPSLLRVTIRLQESLSTASESRLQLPPVHPLEDTALEATTQPDGKVLRCTAHVLSGSHIT